MRCGTVTTIYAFTGTGTTRGTYQAITVGPEGATCTASQYVVMSQTEYTYHTASPFKLTWDEGGQISLAVMLVWATAWAFRVIARVIRQASPSPDVSES